MGFLTNPLDGDIFTTPSGIKRKWQATTKAWDKVDSTIEAPLLDASSAVVGKKVYGLDLYDSGVISAPALTPDLITDPKSLITKEYFDANVSSTSTSTSTSSRKRFEFVGSNNTVLTGADIHSNILVISTDTNLVDVYLNGILLNLADYVLTDTSNITFAAALTTGASITIITG